MTQYRESPDGGTRHVHARADILPRNWTLHDGPIPSPGTKDAEIDAQLEREMLADMATQQRWVTRRAEIETEVRQR